MNDVLDQVVFEIKALPLEKQKEVADLVHSMHQKALQERNRSLRSFFEECEITPEEADEWEKAVSECRRIENDDVEDW